MTDRLHRIILMFLCVVCLSSLVSVFADSSIDSEQINYRTVYTTQLPEVDTDDLIEWANRKGFEVIKVIQTCIQPLAIVVFMIAAIMVLLGSVGNTQIAGRGLCGLFSSIICYCLILYAPSILNFSVAWLGS